MESPRPGLVATIVAAIIVAPFERPILAAVKAIYDVTIQGIWNDYALPFFRTRSMLWGAAMFERIGPFGWGIIFALAVMSLADALWAVLRRRYPSARITIPQTGKQMILLILMIISAGVFAAAASLYVSDFTNKAGSRSEDAEVDFKNAQSFFADRLGLPVSDLEENSNAYTAQHQNAIVVWLQSTGRIYGLFPNGNLISVNDPLWSDGGEFSDPEKLKVKFPNIPDGLHPPVGGIAHYWGSMNSVGWREQWQCSLHSGETFIRRFEKGILVGPFKLASKIPEGYIYAIFNDNNWSQIYAKRLKVDLCN